jgi:hypothetical protein
MPANALSFPEVLEDEYRYFFDDEPFTTLRFDRQHVREVADLGNFLETTFRDGSVSTSRWQSLARRCFGTGGTNSRALSRDAAVIDALNEMLGDPALLEQLLGDHQFRNELTASPAMLQLLLRIPVARRLLLARPELAKQMGADWVIDGFISRSPAIRLLAHGGLRPALRAYPALLSTIADDEELSKALESNPAGRETIRRMFDPSLRDRICCWTAARLPARLGDWLSRRYIHRPADLVALSVDAEKLQLMIDPASPAARASRTIPDSHLSRFNAILVEIAYRHYVSNGQTVRALYGAIHRKETAALCLSGGGIRSATFNLGVLQGLADHRMLNRFHYLSTVSGGGYIGTWLSSWMRRHQEGAVGVAKDLARRPADPLRPEVQPIVHLREYSSYLAPRASAISLDSWTLIATYIRNLLLNWTMLLPFLIAVLALPRLLELYVRENMSVPTPTLGKVSVILALFVALAVGAMRPTCRATVAVQRGAWSFRWWFVPLLGSAVTFCLYWASPDNKFLHARTALVVLFAAGAGLGAVVHAGRRLWVDLMAETGSTEKSPLHKLLAFLTSVMRFRQILRFALLEVAFSLGAGAIGGWLLHYSFLHAFPPHWLNSFMRAEVYVCLGVPLFLGVFFAEVTLLVGFTTFFSEEYEREWWARSAAVLFVYCLLHALLAFAVLLLPVLMFQAPKLAAPFGGFAGIASYLLSRQLKAKKPEEGENRWLMPLLRFAATVTMMFIVAAISILTTSILGALVARPERMGALGGFFDFHRVRFAIPWYVFGDYSGDAAVAHFQALRQTPLAVLYLLIIAATAVAITMSRLLNVNIYSMHGMYRNRLMRAYLGASRWTRRPDAFTGFDPQDNMKMWELRPEMLWTSCIVDFDAFAKQLPREPFWSKVPVDAQNHVLAYLTEEDPEAKRAARDTARTMIVDAINHLMLTADLERGLDAPPSLELLAQNRTFLDGRFKTLIKRFDRGVVLPSTGTERAVFPHAPKEFRDPDPKAVHGRPPLHIVNAALNLVGGDNLAWQERKAASFTISALHSGSRVLGYRDSFEYGHGITLGTALAISGAAVSPNSGASSSPTFTFLMTLLNARLGWWLGNPRRSQWGRNSPTGSIMALLREALGRTDSEQDFVFLSDGGHFENLGLYEMVLRRCKYIIVCDATADDGYAFGDLANAVRKIRVDLGVPIEPLLTKYIGPQQDEKYGRYCALGEIRYCNVDGGDSIGHLLYIKPAVYSDCPADVRNYGKESKTFPQETTVDQFFSESQFESYRALGRHIIGKIAGDFPGNAGPGIVPNVASFFASAFDYLKDKQPPVGDAPVGTMKDLVSWMTTGLEGGRGSTRKRRAW